MKKFLRLGCYVAIGAILLFGMSIMALVLGSVRARPPAPSAKPAAVAYTTRVISPTSTLRLPGSTITSTIRPQPAKPAPATTVTVTGTVRPQPAKPVPITTVTVTRTVSAVSKNAPKPTNTPVLKGKAKTSEPTPQPGALPKSGQAVQQDGYSLAAVDVKDPAPAGPFYQAEPGKKLVAVEIIVENISGKQIGVNPLNATLVDDAGFVYRPELGATQDQQLALVNLMPGEKVRGWVGFKIPQVAKAASIKYQTEALGGSILQVSLAK